MSKKKSMSRDDAEELYRDLQRTMKQMKGGAPKQDSKLDKDVARQIAAAISQGMKRDTAEPSRPKKKRAKTEAPRKDDPVIPPDEYIDFEDYSPSFAGKINGERAAIVFVLFFALFKLSLSALEATGVASTTEANAALTPRSQVRQFAISRQDMRREEIKILTSLDSRRKDLEERARKLDEREIDLNSRDGEFAARLTEIRELTNQLKANRENNERKKNNQLEQLSNVYGSMNPPEAAQLIEQLDVTIALELLERMPEKRIGQILSLMSPERALAITRLLSGTGK